MTHLLLKLSDRESKLTLQVSQLIYKPIPQMGHSAEESEIISGEIQIC